MNQVQPPRIAREAAAAVVNGRKAASMPIASAAIRIVPMRDRVVAGRMNRFVRMLSVMLACSWIPGIDPFCSVDSGVPNTSTSPDAVKPMKTILFLKMAGSRRGFFPSRMSCSAANSSTNPYEGYAVSSSPAEFRTSAGAL